MTDYKATDLQRNSGAITAAIHAGEPITLTHYRKPIAEIIPTKTAGALVPEDLREAVADYAAANGFDGAEALRRLITAGLGAAPAQPTMRSLFPEATAEDMSAEEFDELVAAESDGDGESVEYEYDGREFCLHYTKVRGHWIFETEEPTDETDRRGFQRWQHTYTVCADKREAQQRYREAIIAASKAWRPEDGVPMWADAWDVTFQEFERNGQIPLGTFDTPAAEAAADRADAED